MIGLPLALVRWFVDVLAFGLALGRVVYMRIRGRRKPIRNWLQFAVSLWWFVRTTRADDRAHAISR